MLNDRHREAEELAAEAERLLASGQKDEAARRYSSAADAEQAALALVPEGKIRTQNVLSVSFASLLYKAQRYEEAERIIFQMLGSSRLESWADCQLRELLQVVSDERSLLSSQARRYFGESIVLSLSGGEIGSGTGPLDLILEKAEAFRSLLYRIAEWTAQYPLRVQGGPPKEILQLVQARVSEPAPGSYRLEVRLTESAQMDLFGPTRMQPKAVSDAMFRFLGCLASGTTTDLEELVPDTPYRKALLQLTRNVAPRGKRVSEVGVLRRHGETTESVYLTDQIPKKIRTAMPAKDFPREERRELAGVLRALHLDKNWLEITVPGNKHVKCDTVHDMLDDVVGPMVNQRVIVSGRSRLRYGRSRLLVEEINLDDGA